MFLELLSSLRIMHKINNHSLSIHQRIEFQPWAWNFRYNTKFVRHPPSLSRSVHLSIRLNHVWKQRLSHISNQIKDKLNRRDDLFNFTKSNVKLAITVIENVKTWCGLQTENVKNWTTYLFDSIKRIGKAFSSRIQLLSMLNRCVNECEKIHQSAIYRKMYGKSDFLVEFGMSTFSTKTSTSTCTHAYRYHLGLDWKCLCCYKIPLGGYQLYPSRINKWPTLQNTKVLGNTKSTLQHQKWTCH